MSKNPKDKGLASLIATLPARDGSMCDGPFGGKPGKEGWIMLWDEGMGHEFPKGKLNPILAEGVWGGE